MFDIPHGLPESSLQQQHHQKKNKPLLEAIPFVESESDHPASFVKSFMCFQTPYNSMLLYHGFGSTGLAIGIAENMRPYLKKFQIHKSILIVASPNVEPTFRKQLFNEDKLFRRKGRGGGGWNVLDCVGQSLLPEIREMNFQTDTSKQQVIDRIHSVINKLYTFLGYLEFAKEIENLSTDPERLKREFDGRLVLIDEFHNMRVAFQVHRKQKQKQKPTHPTNPSATTLDCANFDFLLDHADNLRLLLLSAAPSYTSCKEIIWTLNLLRRNDKLSLLAEKEIFTSTGEFLQPTGRTTLMDAARGYVFFVKNDNPSAFPFRVYPKNSHIRFPSIQKTPNPRFIKKNKQLSILNHQLTCVKIKKRQYDMYSQLLEHTNVKHSDSPSNEGLLLQCLNIAYPSSSSSSATKDKGNHENHETLEDDAEHGCGIMGLRRVMTFDDTPDTFGNFEYRSSLHRGFFNLPNLGHYSCKMESICNKIKESKGVILIYSQYLAGGLVPMALALEAMGIHRFHSRTGGGGGGGARNLFQKSAITPFAGASYVMITGDKRLSPNNRDEIQKASSILNRDGNLVKVILMTVAGAEGFELKYIRQVHMLEPCYSLSQTERIIGFASRNFSHTDLPPEERNVEIFLYATLLRKENAIVESFDMYMYRRAEQTAILLGKVTRALKEAGLDCCLQYNSPLVKPGMEYVTQRLSDGTVIDRHPVGDMPYSASCDYMKQCFVAPQICRSRKDKAECKKITWMRSDDSDSDDDEDDEPIDTQSLDELRTKITVLFRKSYLYTYEKLYKALKPSSDSTIYQVLSRMMDDRVLLHDKYNREGYLINVGEYYLFQPKELSIIPFQKQQPHESKISIIDQRNKLRNKHTEWMKQMEPSLEKDNKRQTLGGQGQGQGEEDMEEKKNDPIHHIYNTIQQYYKTPNRTRETGYTLLSCLGFAAATLTHLMGVQKKVIIELAVHCVIDAMSYEEKVALMQSFFRGSFDKEPALKHILDTYFGRMIHTFGPEGTTVVILYQGGEEGMQLAPVVITEKNEIVALEEYEDLKAVKQYLHDYHDRYDRKRLHYPLGIIAGNQFTIAERPVNGGVECVQQPLKSVISYFEKTIPLEFQETFRPIYTSLPGRLLCPLLWLTLKYFNVCFPEKVWYVTEEEHQAIFQEVDLSEYVRDSSARYEEDDETTY